MHWFWRATIAVVVSAILAGLLGTFVVNAFLLFFGSWKLDRPMATGAAVALTALLFMTLPLVIYGVLGHIYPPQLPFDRETRCRKCGYILRGISEPRCPECGERI